MKHLALFAMNLRSKHNVSNTVVQAVMKEYSSLTSENMSLVESRIKALAGDINVDLRNNLLQAVHSNPLSAVLNLQVGPMRSEHARKAYFKEAFNSVEPIEMKLSDGIIIIMCLYKQLFRHCSKMKILTPFCRSFLLILPVLP